MAPITAPIPILVASSEEPDNIERLRAPVPDVYFLRTPFKTDELLQQLRAACLGEAPVHDRVRAQLVRTEPKVLVVAADTDLLERKTFLNVAAEVASRGDKEHNTNRALRPPEDTIV